MKDADIDEMVALLKKQMEEWNLDWVRKRREPYRVLISCILSLRTKDEVTGEASRRLFSLAKTPEEMIALGEEKIREVIYPVGFYNNKAKTVVDVSRRLVEEYGSRVPDDLDELLKLKGVGRKTANLVVSRGFGKPAICVDTHVHRIINRWGYVCTKNPHKTEFALRKKLPQRYWLYINSLLVAFGQRICMPISPKCSICPLWKFCDRIGVEKSR